MQEEGLPIFITIIMAAAILGAIIFAAVIVGALLVQAP